MRSCEKNKRTICYAKFLTSEPILDEFGNDTLEVNQIYSEPVELKVNYSSNVGEDSTKVFGNLTYEKADTIDTYSFEESVRLCEE